jgi:hypothetical protein
MKNEFYGSMLCGWDMDGKDSGFVQWQALVLDVLKPLVFASTDLFNFRMFSDIFVGPLLYHICDT